MLCVLYVIGSLLLAQVLKNKILGAVGHTSAEGRKVADMLVAFSLQQVCLFINLSVTFLREPPLEEALTLVGSILGCTRVVCGQFSFTTFRCPGFLNF